MDLTERQEYELLAAISARGEIPVKFGYLGEGAQRWDSLYRAAEDYQASFTNEELALMSSHIESLIQSFGNIKSINLIDLGCGNGLPAINILKKLSLKKLDINYFSIDLSKEMLEIATRNIHEAFPNIPIKELQIDFESESLASELLGIKQKTRAPIC